MNLYPEGPVSHLTNVINDLYDQGKSLPIDTEESHRQYDAQVRFEARYLVESRICKANGSNSLLGISNADVSGIRQSDVINNLTNKFYDHNLMEEIRCIINTILDISDGKESERQRINTYLKGMKRFGTPSAYNYALKGDIDTQNYVIRRKHSTFKGNMVVIKCPREPAGSKELIHERVLGDHLNNLRKLIPNFSYVYDAFTCSGTTVNNYTKEVIDFCTSDNESVAYVMYENIDNAISLADLAESEIDQIEIAKQFFKYLMQISLSLNLAESAYGFAHRDLHTDNVLLRKYAEKTFALAYSHLGKLVYLLTPGSIATFIDYGMSRVRVPSGEVDSSGNPLYINLGKLDSSGFFENIGLSYKDSFTISDVYKVVCFFIRKCLQVGKPITALHISSLLGGFFYGVSNMSETDIVLLLTGQWDVRYHLPKEVVNANGWNMSDFVAYLNSFYDFLYGEELLLDKVPDGIELFGCFDSCPIPETIREELNIHIAEIPTIDVFVENPNNTEVIDRIYKNMKTVIQNERLEMSNEINSKHHRGFWDIPENAELAFSQIDVYTESIQDLVSVAGISLNLHNRIRKYSYCKDKFGTDKDRNAINKLFSKLISDVEKAYNYNKEYIIRIKESIKQNYIKIQKFIFGVERTSQLTEREVEKYASNPFYDLYTKYRAAITLFDQVGIAL